MADASTSRTYPIGPTDELAQEIWASQMAWEVYQGNFFVKSGMTHEYKGDESAFTRKPGLPIAVKSEFGREAGQKMTLQMVRRLLRGLRTDENGASTLTQYTYGTSYAVGYEQLITMLYANLWLAKIKTQVGVDSPDINGTRTDMKLDPTAKRLLTDWLTDKEEELYVDGMVEGCAYHAYASGFASQSAHPNTYRPAGASSAATVSDTMTMNARELRRISRMCKVKKLQPIKIEGEEAFLVLMSSAVVSDLLQDEEYKTVAANAMARGKDNPLVSGAIGKFHNLYIYEYERARADATYTNVENVMILGADALGVGYGSEVAFYTRSEDGFGDRWGKAIARIMGTGRFTFTNQTSGSSVTLNQSSAIWQVWKDTDEFDV